MMKKDLRILWISLLFVSMFSVFTSISLGQETTSSIEITVKDAAGAVVPNVSLTIESSGTTTGFKRTVTADESGSARVIQVPPGTYSVTAGAIAGFVEKKVDQVVVGLGKTTALTIEMSTTVGATVDVSAGDISPIDVTATNVQTTVTSELAELLPKGINFSTVLKIDPATRAEPRSGQFQIDGASGSENTFIVDGQEVTNVVSGTLDANSNLPFSILQEVQVKSSGFEAEYGGATGGVINVVTKGGGSRLAGEFGVNLRTSRLEPIAYPGLRQNGAVVERYPSRRNQYNETNPVADLRGPFWKNKLWFHFSYNPQLFTQSRTLYYRDNTTRELTGDVETYRFKQRQEKAFARIDSQPFSKLNVTATFNWNPITQEGLIPSFASELNAVPTQAGDPTIRGGAYYNNTGGRQNSMNYTLRGVYSLTSNLIVSARMSHYFLNAKLGTYGFGDVTIPRVACANVPLSPQQFPAGFGCVRGTNNGVGGVANVQYDATTRDQYDGDATYLFSAGGRHELKGGYQYNGIGNKVIYGQNDQITLRYGTTGPATIASISGTPGLPSTPGAVGSGVISTFQTRGDVASKNIGFYIQDKWQPIRRLTLNFGFRTEKEDVPSYAPGLPGMNFGFASKIAPRFGGAYDLTGDGKTKVSAFYGWFYDRFKLELPRGSFGGDEFHSLFFEIFPGDTIANMTRATIFGGGAPIPGGSCQIQAAPIFGRVRCDKDFRVSSNSGGSLTEVGGIDPNIKPFRQAELTFQFQRELSRNYTFSARYSRKRVIRTIEDAGFPNSEGSEYYIIGNPGEGLYLEQAEMFGTLAPKPERKYDALELKIDRRFANDFFFQANYTYSRLYGNYGGLASSDEEGRTDPNVNRYFDQPHAGFTVSGGPDNGILGTDRPHVLKAYGAYSLGWERLGLWKNNTTNFIGFFTASSGTPITSFVQINTISQIILTKRGDQGRTPFFNQTDLAIRHNIKFGRDGRFTLIADADFINVFGQGIVTNKGLNPSGQGGNIINTSNFSVLDPQFNLITAAELAACNAAGSQQQCLVTAYRRFQDNGSPELLAAATSPIGRNIFYNYPSAYQAKRTIRYGLRLVF